MVDLKRTMALAALAIIVCEMGAGRAYASDVEMRQLTLEYLSFARTPDFQRRGYAAGGPYHEWNERVVKLNSSQPYARSLIARCGVVPIDLWNAGVAAMSPDSESPRSAAHYRQIEEKFASCFRGRR